MFLLSYREIRLKSRRGEPKTYLLLPQTHTACSPACAIASAAAPDGFVLPATFGRTSSPSFLTSTGSKGWVSFLIGEDEWVWYTYAPRAAVATAIGIGRARSLDERLLYDILLCVVLEKRSAA